MSRFADAVSWSGRAVTLSLFVVFPADGTRAALVHARGRGPSPIVRTYHLEDAENRLGGRQCYEFDLVFDAVPHDAEAVVAAWLRAAVEAGAEVAWFAFEGSFDFDHVLTADIASQIFAVGGGDGIELAIDDSIRSAPEWAARIVDVREKVCL